MNVKQLLTTYDVWRSRFDDSFDFLERAAVINKFLLEEDLPEEENMFGTRRMIVAHLRDCRERCHEKGDHETCKKIDEVLEAPRRKRRLMLETLVADIERRTTTVEFWSDTEADTYEGILDLFQWLLENFDTILALIERIISLFNNSQNSEPEGV